MTTLIADLTGPTDVPAVMDPSDFSQVGVDWTALVDQLGTTIFTSTWTGDGLTVDNDAVVTGDKKTTARISGGTAGQTYTVANKIVTAGTPAYTYERSLRITVGNR